MVSRYDGGMEPDGLALNIVTRTNMTTANQPLQKQETKLNKALRIIHLIVAALVVLVAVKISQQGDSAFATGFLLSAFGLMLTSLGALHLTNRAQKVVIVISLLVAAAGAFSFVQAFKSAAQDGPLLHKVIIDFRATQYDVLPINNAACAPKGDGNPLHYTCDVKVLPLPPAPISQNAATQ